MKQGRSWIRVSGLPLAGGRWTLISALGLVMVAAAPAPSQEMGTVTGQVVDARSAAPISGAQVFLEGSGIGTLTGQNGRFVLLNVPAGSYTLQVERIGYAAVTREVTVPAEGSIEADVELEQAALGLDELVVTGTAGAARRREIGNTIEQINVTDLQEPIVNMDALLQARAPGLNVTGNNGTVGGGASIRLRGNVSAAMSNQPLIYIDGVRVRSDGLPKNVPPAGYGGRGPNTAYSPLNDINPADIERVEVIKGAAATTLYGAEAAAGVIQIFTRRGATGQARWTMQIDQGVNVLHQFGPTTGIRGEPLVVPPNEDDPSYMFMDEYLRNGYRQGYALSVSGGMETVQYFLSGSFDQQEGVLPNDLETQTMVRGNLTFSPLENLQLQWNTSYANNDLDQTPGGPNAQGIILNTFRRDRNYLGTTDPAVVGRILEYENNTYIDRFITGLTATYSPLANFTNRFTIGYDFLQQQTTSLRPFGFILQPNGIAHDTRWQNTVLTLDYVGTVNFDFTSELRSSFSFGGQSVTTNESSATAYGEDFPGPGRPTVSSAAVTLGFQELMRVINAGIFMQEVLDFRDRYFLTLGLRVDGNSAFGEDLGLQAYPKASVSYVISDEPFWNDALGTVKLRAAYGHAGRAPGAFDAVRTWSPVGWGGEPAFRPNNLGNSELGPERTAELELGFDGSFLDDRLAIDFTWYRQETTDALFFVRQPPSEGFGGSQLENVGALENRGVEVAINASLYESEDWGVDVGGSLSTNHGEVLDLGRAAPFSIGNNGWIVEGQPVPVIRGDCITNPDALAEPIVETDCDYGPNLPTSIWMGNLDVRLPYGLQLTARGEYQRGAWAYSVNDGEAFTRGIRWPNCFNAYPAIDAGDVSSLTAAERARCIASNANRDYAIYPLDFFKLREATLSAPVPFAIPGASSARIVFSARNALSWKKENSSYFDPEDSGGFLVGDTGLNQRVRSVGGNVPIPAMYTVSVRLSF